MTVIFVSRFFSFQVGLPDISVINAVLQCIFPPTFVFGGYFCALIMLIVDCKHSIKWSAEVVFRVEM